MVKLQFFSPKSRTWIDAGEFCNERIAWFSLGGDDVNYRTICSLTGEVLTDKRLPEYLTD